MITQHKQEEREVRKSRILRGALTVFKEKGIEKTTMDEIAHYSGFGKATLYYYYKSKEDVFNAIMVQGWKKLWAGIEDLIVSEGTPRQTLLDIIMKLTEMVNEDRSLFDFLFFVPHYVSTSEQKEPEWKQYQLNLYNTLLHLIEEGVEADKFPQIDSKLILKAMGGLFHGMVFMGKKREELKEEDIERLIAYFLRKEIANC